jgi:hypothetical protein
MDQPNRLDLIRTLRELGVDLATVRRVLDREVSVSEVAAVHVEALDVQIRTLRLRRAVLRAVVRGGDRPRGVELMHKLVSLSDAERHRCQVGGDPRVERYWQLLAIINGWPAPPPLAPVFAWFGEALRQHPTP